MISLSEAYRLTLETIRPLGTEPAALLQAVGRIASQDIFASIDVPCQEVSFVDGYALHSESVRDACPAHPVRLRLVGSIAAGGSWQYPIPHGSANLVIQTLAPLEAVRILTGAPLPPGADAVLAEEFTRAAPGEVIALNSAEPGRNILPRGADVQLGQRLVRVGQRLQPAAVGLLGAAGCTSVNVFRRPRVAIVATGDEIVAPGQPLEPGKLYASNLYTLAAWCRLYGFEVEPFVVPDDASPIRLALKNCLERSDALLTSGGAWKGDRDLTAHILDSLGWQKIYHRVRIGPGKAVGFGILQGKPLFILPGGPPSNHMAFLQLALPGLLALSGYADPGLPRLPAVLAETLAGQKDWTQFIHGRLELDAGCLHFIPIRSQSRLGEIAHTTAIAQIPEGVEQIIAGSTIMVQALVVCQR